MILYNTIVRSQINMKIKYVSEENGTVEFSPKKFLPMTYDVLVCAMKNGSPLKCEGIADTFDVLDEDNHENSISAGKFSFKINFRHNPSIFALVEGGWLPLPFANPSIFLVDRNVISVLSKISKTKRSDIKDTEWWIDFMKNSGFIINPILYAFEGGRQRLPTFNEFIDSLKKASLEIAKIFPNAKLIQYSDQTYNSVYKIVADFADRTDRETKFLLKVVNKIINRAKDSDLPKIQSEIIKYAVRYRLVGKSLLVLAVLSCLYEKKDGSGFSFARKIIKPKNKYNEKNAYNAIADMRLLEFFIASFGLIELKDDMEPLSLCTCDKSVALFWCALKTQYIKFQGNKLNINFTVSEELFPRLNESEREELSHILSQ